MTTISSNPLRLPASDVLGPYSVWPRKKHPTRQHIAATLGTTSLALFFHCAVPLIA